MSLQLPTSTELTGPMSHDADSEAPAAANRSLERSIMYLIGSVAGIVVSGFAAYRWQAGDYTGATINILIVAMAASTMLLGRIERFSALALNLFGITTSSACLLSSLFVSNNGLLWAMLVILANTLTLSRRWALGLNVLVIVVLTASIHLYQSLLQQVSWATVAILIAGFSQMSMDQLREQRRQLARQAHVDPLTGAGNRRLMKTHLLELVAGRGSGESIDTLMVFDLDRFKQVNDQHGHETGDRVLVDFVRSVQSALRASDGFYRMGGEEFVLLLRGMNEATAQTHLTGLHHRLSGQVTTPSGPVEFSAGAASLQEDEDWSQWLARADEALYKAKAAGRNQLNFSE